MTGKVKTPGETMLDGYLRSRALDFGYEVPQGAANPDFTVQLPEGPVVLEVYEPEFHLPHEAGSIDTYSVVRSAIRRKARQGRGARDQAFPYVLVLGSTNADVPFGEHNVPGGSFGDLTVRIPISADPAEDPDPGARAETGFGGGSRLQSGLNRRFSAVAVIRSFNPTMREVERRYTERLAQVDADSLATTFSVIRSTYEECAGLGLFDPGATENRLLVFHNPHAENPLTLDAFGGPYDDQWGGWIDPQRGLVYSLVAQGIVGNEVPGRDEF